MRILALWLLLCGIAWADTEYFAKVLLTPPEAVFSVRHSKGIKIPGGPDPAAHLPSGSTFKVANVDGERGIIVAVHQQGYQDFEQKYALAPGKEYWDAKENTWVIPIELSPAGAFSTLSHQLRFHPLFPVLALLGLAMAIGIPLFLQLRKTDKARKAARVREQEAAIALKAAQEMKEENDPRLDGKTVGCYQVLRQLGEGGFATVYLVEHTEYHDQFAMKILKRGQFTDDTVSRMARELAIGRDLSHPNLVKIVAFGEHRNAPYLVMDYVQGRQIAEILEKGRPRLDETLALFEQMCEGVAYAHSLGIVHRDLKPENMILTPEGVLKILDFGIAKPVDDQEKLTKTGEAFGTPSYMSPEQLRGAPEIRTDIYALGVILFEMATGRLPFGGGEPMEIMAGHLFKPAPKMSSIVRGLPGDLETLVQAMLMKDPEQRAQKVEDVLVVVKKIRASRAVPN